MTDWKALCEELLGLWDAQPLPPHESSRASVIARIRGALAQPEPEVVGPTDEELLEINDGAYCPCTDEVNDEDDSSWQCTSDYIRWLDENGTPEEQGAYAAKGLRAVFNAGRRWGHQPAPPAEGEVAELVQRLRYAKQNGNSIPSRIHWVLDDGTEHHGSIYVGSNHAADCARAADLLEQRHPTPVPVSERLPGPEDCDGEHCCWRWNTI